MGVGGAQDLRDRERVRRHLHPSRPAPAQPRRGGPLPVPPRRVLGTVLQRLPGERGHACTSTSAATRSTPRPSATRSRTSWRTTRRGSASWRVSSRRPRARLRDEGIRGVIYLFKNNTDSAGNSYGCHENYLTSRRDDFVHFAQVLIPFLVTRQIYAGAGKVLQTARGAVFCLPSAPSTSGRASPRRRHAAGPIINTRDEPHADAERYRRLHVIVGDSNMSEYATFLKVGATSIMLRMLEDPGVVLRDMTLEDPIRAIREISHDITCRRQVRLAERARGRARSTSSPSTSAGRCATASATAFPPLEERALQMWEHCVEGIENGPALARPRVRLGDQAPPRRGLPAAPLAPARPPPARAARSPVP